MIFGQNEKLPSWLRFMIGIISNPDDKIATGFGSQTTTDNRIAIWVLAATAPPHNGVGWLAGLVVIMHFVSPCSALDSKCVLTSPK